jgi:hypothetical protein
MPKVLSFEYRDLPYCPLKFKSLLLRDFLFNLYGMELHPNIHSMILMLEGRKLLCNTAINYNCTCEYVGTIAGDTSFTAQEALQSILDRIDQCATQ